MKKLILIGFLVTAGQALAEPAAKILYTQNKVTVTHNGSAKALARGATVEAGDQITTFADAAVNLQYTNGSLVNIGADSTYKILAYAPNSDVAIQAELSNGKIEVQNKGQIKETLKTPIVSLAILGTHFNVDVTSSKMTYVQVIEGLILARNEYLRPGDSVRVTKDRIENFPFPKEGYVKSPLTSPGKIEGTDVTAAAESGLAGSTGALITTYVATNQEIGVATTTGTEAIQSSTAIADISLVCNSIPSF